MIFSNKYTEDLLPVDIHISMVEILPRDKAENEKLTVVVKLLPSDQDQARVLRLTVAKKVQNKLQESLTVRTDSQWMLNLT